MTFLDFLVILAAVGLGLAIGIYKGGIHIHIHKEETGPKPTEYNESLADFLPKNVQEYYQKHDGMNKF